MNAKTFTRTLAAQVAWVSLICILSSFSNSSMAQVIAYPDLRVITSTSQISIGNPTPSTRELRFRTSPGTRAPGLWKSAPAITRRPIRLGPFNASIPATLRED